MNDYDWEEGECPTPTVYEQKDEPLVIYDADGNPMVIQKIKLGFDLS